ILTDESILEKTISNLKETEARGANIITISNRKENIFNYSIHIPKTDKLLQPLLTVIPLQMVAYEVAKLRNCDIDKPKNLAKSVTVE
ncbi:MAG: glutamine--fructose-6-phosphate aminotransferase, partial [Bacilli bacterium]|nr:glutamine--fructose-6-phosphate aminotransferase [Bacilli bacterium]